MKKFILALIPALLIVVIIGYFSITKPQKRNISPAVDAIPQNVSFFLDINNFPDFLSDLNNNEIWANFVKTSGFSQLKKYYSDANYLLETFPKLKSQMADNRTILAVRRQGKSNVDLLLIVSFKSVSSLNKFKHTLYVILEQTKTKVKPLTYNNFKVYRFTVNNTNYYASFTNGLFLFSKSYLLLQNSLRQLTSTSSLTTLEEFSSVAQNAGLTANATLFVNYKELQYAFVNVLSNFGLAKMGKLGKFANWSALDLQLSKDYIRMIGYTSVDEKLDKYLRIFYDIEPVKFYVDKILPGNTVEYTVFGFESFEKFQDNYVKYLTSKDLNQAYRYRLKQIKKNYGLQPDIDLVGAIGNTITLAKVRKSMLQKTTYKYMIINLNSVSLVKRELHSLIEAYKEKHPNTKPLIATSKEYGVKVYKLPDTLFFSALFGKLARFPYQKYGVFIDNYLVLSDDKHAIEFFLDSYKNDDVLIKRDSYKAFRQNLTPKTNIITYVYKPFVLQNLEYYLNPQYQKVYRNNQQFYNSLEHFAAEYYFSDNIFMTYITTNFNPKAASSKIIWTRKLLGEINTKPFIFINHNTGEKEIFVGDKRGNIYLISRDGEILWTRNIGEPIMGDIYMIDYYQNHKYQLLFNTKNKIYIVDRKSRDVENFPVQLPAPASASISVFDYEKDGNYRIFVPCSNNIVYLYGKNGKIKPTWIRPKTSAPVKYPVQHFVYKGRDYIVFADDIHTYILNRKGEVRIDVKRTFPKAPNTGFYLIPKDKNHARPMFVTTTKSGKLAFIDFLGNVFIVKTPHNFSSGHYFVVRDITGDSNLEYIYGDGNKLTIYTEKDKKITTLAEYKANGDINSYLTLYNFGVGNIKVGFLTDQNLIYLVDKKGLLHPGFPKQATTRFTISQLIPGEPFRLIVGNGNYLITYQF